MKFIVLLIFAVCRTSAQIRVVGPPIYMGSSLDSLKFPALPPPPFKPPPAPPKKIIPDHEKFPSIAVAESQVVPIVDIADLELAPPPKVAFKSTNFKPGPSFYEPLPNEDPIIVPPCNITLAGRLTPFALIDNIYVPCHEPNILDPIRIGSPLPPGIKVQKGTQQTIAIKIPSPSSSLVGIIASRNNIIQSNISSPIFGRKNPAFHRGVKVKNWKRQHDCQLAQKSQIDLISSIHTILTNEVRVKGAFAYSGKEKSYVKNVLNLPPMQIHHIQSFGLSPPAPLSGKNQEEYRLSDDTFGFRGSRFEFEEPWRTARMIEKTISKTIGNFTDRNYMQTFHELFRFTNNAHMELHNLGEFQSKTVYKQEYAGGNVTPLSRKSSMGDPVILEPINIRVGASYTSTLCRGNY